MPASATTTKERVPDALLRLAKTVAAGKWHSVMGDRDASQAGVQADRGVDGEEEPSERGVQGSFDGLSQVCIGRLVSDRVKLDAAPLREKRNLE